MRGERFRARKCRMEERAMAEDHGILIERIEARDPEEARNAVRSLLAHATESMTDDPTVAAPEPASRSSCGLPANPMSSP